MKRLALLMLITLLAAACGPAATPETVVETIVQTQTVIQTQEVVKEVVKEVVVTPTPGAYDAIIEASKTEKDGLLIYSIMGERNWAPVLEGFKARYPWIEVTTTDLGAYEVFERYYTEAAGNARTGDMIITAAPDGWINFASKGEVLPYVSVEDANIPDIGKVSDGIYAVSTDPMVFIWNTSLMPTPPTTMAELVSLIQADPGAFTNKIVTYDAAGEGFGYGLNWYYTQAKGDEGWATLEAIGATKPTILTSGGRMIDSVLAGESVLGYFVSMITVQPRLASSGGLLGWAYVPDGQIVVVRGMAVTQKAASPNSAKLMLDYILSDEGQIAFALGGLTAYRPDVAARSRLHLNQVIEAVGGEENLIISRPSAELADQARHDEFITHWQTALQIQP
jgi:iron(III) transport system substrate-binding protein